MTEQDTREKLLELLIVAEKLGAENVSDKTA